LYVYPSPEGVSVYIQDVSEYKRLKTEHRRMEKQMQKAQKMEAIGQLTAGIAHDFNNILASINGYTDLALTRCVGEGQEKLQEYLGQVYKAGERARDLIQQMMAYSRSTEVDMSALDPRPLIRETVTMMRASLPTSIQLNVNVPADSEQIIINMEPVQLQQIIMNLCVNARDAMHSQGRLNLRLNVVHQLRVECVSCHEVAEGDYVALSVQDSGEGMNADILEHLFEPFFTTKDVGEGTGLGLSVVHGIVHEHGGHISVESVVDQGTTFNLLFPLLVTEPVSVQAEDVFAHNAENMQSSLDATRGKRILVVDDEIAVLGFLQAWLERKGFSVQAFQSSQKAWVYFKAYSDEVDLLITDQTMPVMTGNKLIQKVLALRPQLPRILCSGYGDQFNAEQIVQPGACYFADKPFNHGQLLEVIKQLLDEKEAKNRSGAP